MNSLQIATGFRKELWEFKKTLLWVPTLVAIILLLVPLVPILLTDNFQLNLVINKLTVLQQNPPLRHTALGVQSAITSVFSPFIMASLFVQLFYFISCLFDERRDQSVIFWRSLPVSDFQTLAIKLVTGALIIPAIFMLAATVVVGIIIGFLLLASIALSLNYDVALWGYWAEAEIILNLISIWINIFPYALWLFPVYAWLMMTSMFANRTPFLWAVLPIAMVLLIESLVVAYLDLNSSFVAEALIDYLQLSSGLVPGSLSSYESPKTALFSALLGKLSIVATLIGCVFMYLTYWLRINRTAE